MDVLELIAPQAFKCPSNEGLLTGVEYFGLTTASPVQRAICRALDGLSLQDLGLDSDVIQAFGGKAAIDEYEALVKAGAVAIATYVLLAGVRTGKSLIAACAIVRSALTCDLSRVLPGEPMPRASVVSTALDTAKPTWDHIFGHISNSRILSARLVGKPTANSLVLRHESGAPVEVAVVAGSRGASTLVARWSAGVIFDEAPRMLGQDDAVVNLDEAIQFTAARMLPGAPVILSGSPHAPFGPVYKLVSDFHGKPSRKVLVIRARGPAMNPKTWTPEACAELKANNPDAYRVDVETEFLDPESGLLSYSEIESISTLDRHMPPLPGHYYCAAIDPATRGNAWTVVVLGRERDNSLQVVYAFQWIGSISEPLSPTKIFADIAAILQPYRITTLYTDEWAADALIEIAGSCNLWLISKKTTATEKLERFTTLKSLVSDKALSLPNNNDLKRDLASVRKVTTATGVAIHLPLNASGRHCDYAPALALAIQYAPPNPDSEESIKSAEDAERCKNDAALAQRENARLEVLRTVAANNKRIKRGY